MVEQESRIGSFKAELQKAADGHSASVHKDLERQQGFLEKMRSEIRHEIDKLAASQRLDLNLEKGRMRDELQVRAPVYDALCAASSSSACMPARPKAHIPA